MPGTIKFSLIISFIYAGFFLQRLFKDDRLHLYKNRFSNGFQKKIPENLIN